MTESKQQFNFMTVLLAAAFIIVVGVFFTSFKKVAMREAPVTVDNSTIQSADGLSEAESELDEANLDTIDPELDQIKTDSASL